MDKLSERFQYYCGLLSPFINNSNVNVDDFAHIQSLINAEEQGLLLKLPCKVGDRVYVVGTKCLANVITDEDCDDMPGCEMCKYDKEYVVFNRVVDEHFLIDLLYEKNSNFIFGKTVFLTYEEASKRLNEISN